MTTRDFLEQIEEMRVQMVSSSPAVMDAMASAALNAALYQALSRLLDHCGHEQETLRQRLAQTAALPRPVAPVPMELPVDRGDYAPAEISPWSEAEPIQWPQFVTRGG